MGLSSILKRKASGPVAAEPADAVQQARTRARQRLIGAVVLLGIGIVGFPLVFETEPRPVPVDIPIEIPRKDAAAPLSLPPAVATAPSETAPRNVPPTPSRPDDILTEPREEEPARASPAPDRAPAASSPRPMPAQRPAAEPKVAADDGVRARALLDGAEPAASAAPPRFVVQVGAFADATAARDTRQKMEKLGLKTYTQAASTAAGGRIRVRLGPFATRDEADRALSRARSAGLAGVVISL